jgi:hypothetical protein
VAYEVHDLGPGTQVGQGPRHEVAVIDAEESADHLLAGTLGDLAGFDGGESAMAFAGVPQSVYERSGAESFADAEH